MKITLWCLLNINIPVVVCQGKLWYNKHKNIEDVKGVIMLFIDLIDILYLLVGIIIGACIVSGIDYLICKDCKLICEECKRSDEYDE